MILADVETLSDEKLSVWNQGDELKTLFKVGSRALELRGLRTPEEAVTFQY